MADYAGKHITFLQGSQVALNGLRTSGAATEGAFYLTNDTRRLYIGEKNEDGTKVIPQPVNQGVISYATVAEITALTGSDIIPGQFYYGEDKNIICVYSGGKWVQINPDTTLKSSSAANTVSAITKGAKITTKVEDTANNTVNGEFSIISGAGVQVTNDGNVITIAATGAGGATIELSVEGATDNKSATIKQKTTITKADGTTEPATEDSYVLAAGDNVDTLVVTKDEAGKETVTINAKTQEVTELTGAAQAEGFKVTLKQTSNTDKTAQINPEISVGKTGDKSSVKFVNGTANLDVYTTTQADEAIDAAVKAGLQTYDALHFKGVVKAGNDLPDITAAENGDVYKVGAVTAKVTAAAPNAKVGDLLIATGTEGTNGKLEDSGTWELVPSGDEASYITAFLEHGLDVKEKVGDTQTSIGGLQLTAGTNVVLTDTADGKIKKVEVAHEAITTEEPAAEATTAYGGKTNSVRKKEITVVKDIEVSNGHVTKIVTGKETIEDTDKVIESITNTATADEAKKVATVTTTIKMTNEDVPKSGTSKIASDSLEITASNDQVNVNLVWGTF